jgi:hypothetical protein
MQVRYICSLNGMILQVLLKINFMTQNSQERQKAYNEQDKEINDLQKKYNVDMQEVLNAVIDADNDLEKAEDYLKKRTEKQS